MNRLARDELLHAALDQADKGSLDEHDRPAGVILEGAHSIGWLQRGLDLAHHLYPMGGTITTHALTLQPGVTTYLLPTDYNQDVLDGMIVVNVQTNQRAFRSSLENLLNYQISAGINPPTQRAPVGYVIMGRQCMVYPTPDKPYAATLWYYAMPPILSHGAMIPSFPDDNALVKYVFWNALEWARAAEPGTAENYLRVEVGKLQQAGYGREPMRKDIPLDPHVVRQGSMARPESYDWMGATTIP